MVQETGYAKINLALDIVGQREDGYHLVRMVMHTVGIADRLEISVTDREGEVILLPMKTGSGIADEEADKGSDEEADAKSGGAGAALSYGEDNLVVKAARALFREAAKKGGQAAENIKGKGLRILLEKNIPVQAGMAGGSTDCAAALRGINRALELGFSAEALCRIGTGLGADVPFCIMGGTALSEGIGEVLTPLTALPEAAILIAKPPAGISTPEAYRGYDELMKKAAAGEGEEPERPDIDRMIEGLTEGNLEKVASSMGNVLEPVTGPRVPEIAELEKEMLSAGAVAAQMSGSGPTVFGIFADTESAWQAAERLSGKDLAEAVFVV